MPGESTGFIVIGLRVGRTGAWAAPVESLHELARKVGAVELSRVLDDFTEVPSERLVRSVPPERVLELERKAAGRGASPARSLTSFWQLDVRRSDRGPELLDRLSHVRVVEFAYPEIPGSDPQVNPSDDPYAAAQRYVDAAPVGIDAEWAWTFPYGSGASVGFVDLEQGWDLGHEDLPTITMLPGVPQDVNVASIRHGTGVLGIVVGVDNQLGIVGVAPTPAWVSVASHYRADESTSGHVADALVSVLASGALADGDVILIEYQDAQNRPAEMEPPIRIVIQDLTALGMIVVEAAGNGDIDLDTVPELNRNGPAFEESGAIIVGGSMAELDAAGVGHDRWIGSQPPPGFPRPASNYGSRIDCHAQAERVVTAGPASTPAGVVGPGVGPADEYRKDFGGTSAAAAIVAGAAVVLQGIHKAVKKAPLTPIAMRNALSKYGTPQGTGQPGHIGVMPDLRKAASALRIGGKKPARHGRPSAPTNVRIVS